MWISIRHHISHSTGRQNPRCIVNTMPADDLGTTGAKTSATTALIRFIWTIPGKPAKGCICSVFSVVSGWSYQISQYRLEYCNMSIMDLKSPATGLFIQEFVPAIIKGNIKGQCLSHPFLKFKWKYRWTKFNEIWWNWNIFIHKFSSQIWM